MLGLRTAAHPSASKNTACCWCVDCWPFWGEVGGRERDRAEEALVSREPGKVTWEKNAQWDCVLFLFFSSQHYAGPAHGCTALSQQEHGLLLVRGLLAF